MLKIEKTHSILSLRNLFIIEGKVDKQVSPLSGLTPAVCFLSQGQGDQVQVGSFAAKARKCHRPHHPVSREDREEAGEAAEVSDCL